MQTAEAAVQLKQEVMRMELSLTIFKCAQERVFDEVPAATPVSSLKTTATRPRVRLDAAIVFETILNRGEGEEDSLFKYVRR